MESSQIVLVTADWSFTAVDLLPSQLSGRWRKMALLLCQAQPLFFTAMTEKPMCCRVPEVTLNPSHSPQNDREDFIHESCGVRGRGINTWCILRMPDNNCYHSPWKDKMMDTCWGLGEVCFGGLFGDFLGWFFFGLCHQTTWLGFGTLGCNSPHPA